MIVLDENDGQQLNNHPDVIHIVRDLREDVVSDRVGRWQQNPDDLQYLQHREPFIGTDDSFEAQNFNVSNDDLQRANHEDEDAIIESVGPYPIKIMREASLLPSISSLQSVLAAGLTETCYPRQFYAFWNHIMAFFFSRAQGYTFEHDWLPFSLSASFSHIAPVSLAVFHDDHSSHATSSRHHRHTLSHMRRPRSRVLVALVQISSPLDFENALLRETAARLVLDQCEEVAQHTPTYDSILLISGMGKAWRAWQKDTSFTEEEARRWGLPRDNGAQGMLDSEWMEDVISEVSKDVLSVMSEDIKSQCTPRARSRHHSVRHDVPRRRRSHL